MSTIFSYLFKALVIYCALVAAMYFTQRKLMYFPNRTLLTPTEYGVPAEAIILTAADNTQLVAWMMPAKPDMPTILHFHGNAGNIADRREVYNAYQQAGFGVLALEWRGYGSSTGSPSEQGFYEDARAALAYLKRNGLHENQIILYGESIGTGPAIQMATEIEARAIILEAPFTSLWQRAADIHWYIPTRYLIKDRFDSMSKIKQVNEPLLIIHNQRDRIVPHHHGVTLFQAANEPKEMMSIDADGHITFDRLMVVQKTIEFLNNHPLAQ